MTASNAEMIRVGFPLPSGGARWLFLSREDESKWHPWWGELFRFLSGLEPRQAAGTDESGRPMEVAIIRADRRAEFRSVIDSAPASEIEAHRTLRAVPRLLDECDGDIEVRYFIATPVRTPRE